MNAMGDAHTSVGDIGFGWHHKNIPVTPPYNDALGLRRHHIYDSAIGTYDASFSSSLHLDPFQFSIPFGWNMPRMERKNKSFRHPS